ncbi:hypothetical protein TrCOL_g10178 [Triparma columacea]|uniref:Uncharacterized protein n=1 Tax=Triparma columacea TaxID=722753 RepID=A0A9W7FWC3_9STRA|nr:hypothetical protein TrCOL_g10178 [Triparma columacea]
MSLMSLGFTPDLPGKGVVTVSVRRGDNGAIEVDNTGGKALGIWSDTGAKSQGIKYVEGGEGWEGGREVAVRSKYVRGERWREQARGRVEGEGGVKGRDGKGIGGGEAKWALVGDL